jgi:hypothetical protein
MRRPCAQTVKLVVAAAVAMVSCPACSLGGGQRTTSTTAETVGTAWITYRDREHDFSISYPPSWQRARQSLTPNRTEPRELVTVGTDLLLPTPSDMNCAQASARALRALGHTGALISLAEVSDADAGDYPPRPETFHLSDGDPGEAVACVPDPQFTERVIFFRVDHRVFLYAVFLGKNVSPTTRRQTAAVLNSLSLPR